MMKTNARNAYKTKLWPIVAGRKIPDIHMYMSVSTCSNGHVEYTIYSAKVSATASFGLGLPLIIFAVAA